MFPHSRRMPNPHFYVYRKRPIGVELVGCMVLFSVFRELSCGMRSCDHLHSDIVNLIVLHTIICKSHGNY